MRTVQRAAVVFGVVALWFPGAALVAQPRTAIPPQRGGPPSPETPYILVTAFHAPEKKLARPVTLAAIKADRAFADFPLVRMSRLSVMPVTDSEWTRIEKMSRG